MMIINDQVISQLLLTEALRHLGFEEVATVKDAEDALTALRSTPRHRAMPDPNLPRMKGLELLGAVPDDPMADKDEFAQWLHSFTGELARLRHEALDFDVTYDRHCPTSGESVCGAEKVGSKVS